MQCFVIALLRVSLSAFEATFAEHCYKELSCRLLNGIYWKQTHHWSVFRNEWRDSSSARGRHAYRKEAAHLRREYSGVSPIADCSGERSPTAHATRRRPRCRSRKTRTGAIANSDRKRRVAQEYEQRHEGFTCCHLKTRQSLSRTAPMAAMLLTRVVCQHRLSTITSSQTLAFRLVN